MSIATPKQMATREGFQYLTLINEIKGKYPAKSGYINTSIQAIEHMRTADQAMFAADINPSENELKTRISALQQLGIKLEPIAEQQSSAVLKQFIAYMANPAKLFIAASEKLQGWVASKFHKNVTSIEEAVELFQSEQKKEFNQSVNKITKLLAGSDFVLKTKLSALLKQDEECIPGFNDAMLKELNKVNHTHHSNLASALYGHLKRHNGSLDVYTEARNVVLNALKEFKSSTSIESDKLPDDTTNTSSQGKDKELPALLTSGLS